MTLFYILHVITNILFEYKKNTTEYFRSQEIVEKKHFLCIILPKKRGKKMIQKTLRIPDELYEEIMKLAEESDRDFTKQVLHMIKQYLKISKNK